MKKLLFLISVIFLTACTHSPAKKMNTNQQVDDIQSVTDSLFYKKCISRFKRYNYIDLEEKCSCMEDKFINTNLSYIQQAEACSHLGIRADDVVIPPKELCENYQIKKNLSKGDVIVQYQTFEKDELVPGVKAGESDLIWSVVDKNEEGFTLMLERGVYYTKNVGDTTRISNNGYYKKAYPEAPLWEQIDKEYRVCVGPKL